MDLPGHAADEPVAVLNSADRLLEEPAEAAVRGRESYSTADRSNRGPPLEADRRLVVARGTGSDGTGSDGTAAIVAVVPLGQWQASAAVDGRYGTQVWNTLARTAILTRSMAR